jgi:hypothetical protein
MLSGTALESLVSKLQYILSSFELPLTEFGQPRLLQAAAEEAAKTFQGYAKARPSKADAYAAALAFYRGQPLDERQVDLVAGALSEPLREAGNARCLGASRLLELLAGYQRDSQAGDLWRLTWFGLLGSYFAFNPTKATKAEVEGWQRLRDCLQRSWPHIDKQSGDKVVPDWVAAMRRDPNLVTETAADRYALDYLHGDESGVKRLSEDLAIPESSWFWHALVLSAVRRCAEHSDKEFKEAIPQILTLISARPVYRDEALEIVLTRYQRCADSSVHAQLRDYVCRKDVWRNPKLRAAGLATAWNRVSDDVWQMVLHWVNKANLQDFFAVLAARRQADEGRLEFWSQYMEQISWTRLIFSAQTKSLAYSNEGIRNLIAREEDSYATISTNADVDAFMMQLGEYLVVEFSKVPNAAYVYKASELPFEPYSREYAGTSDDLKFGFRNDCAARFTHPHGWQLSARSELRRLGIHPDQPASATRVRRVVASEQAQRSVVSDAGARRDGGALLDRALFNRRNQGADEAPARAPFTMAMLRRMTEVYPGVSIDDRRGASGGRLWIEDPQQRVIVGQELELLGFKWANSRQAWYYPEN